MDSKIRISQDFFLQARSVDLSVRSSSLRPNLVQSSLEVKKNFKHTRARGKTPLTDANNFEIIDFPDKLETDNEPFDYFFVKSLDFYSKSEYFSAIHHFKKALEYHPENFECKVNIGVCYYKLQLMDEASIVFSKMIISNPEDYIPYFNKAMSEFKKNEYLNALVTLDKALYSLKPVPEIIRKLRTFILYRSGNIPTIIHQVKSKNGFETKKTSFIKEAKQNKIILNRSRPQSSNPRKRTLLHLFPEGKQNFVNVPEVYIKSKTREKKLVSNTASPKSLKSTGFNNRYYKKINKKDSSEYNFDPQYDLDANSSISDHEYIPTQGFNQENIYKPEETLDEDKESDENFKRRMDNLKNHISKIFYKK